MPQVNSNSLIKVLFLASDPSDAARLRLGQELRDIRERLQLSKHREIFVLESRESVRPGDISQAIFDVEPQIVHFSGHGTSTGDLCFEDVLGKVQPVLPSALAALFELVANHVNCVILNACYSEAQAEAIAKHIPFVIGMKQTIGDKAAIAFAVGFYKALGAGRSLEEAHKFGCAEIQLQGISDHLVPVLYPKKLITEIEKLDDNIQKLKADAYRFQIEEDFESAEQLWIKVLAKTAGQDMEAVKALQKLAQLRLEPSETLLSSSSINRDISEHASYKNTEESSFGKIGAFLQSAANSASENIANIFDQERDKNDIAFTMRKRLKSGNYKVVQGIFNTETGELAEKRVFEGEQIDSQLLDEFNNGEVVIYE